MCRSCRQLASGERCQIWVLMSGGDSIRETARYLECSNGQPRDRPQPCFRRSAQAGGCAVAADPWPAEGGLEPGTDRGPPEASGRGDGGPGVDLPLGASRPRGGRRPVPVPPAEGEEAELAGRPAFRGIRTVILPAFNAMNRQTNSAMIG